MALEFLPYDIRLAWRGADSCDECADRPHDMKALDWGLLELAWRDWWDKARDRLAALADLRTHDFKLFMGNFQGYIEDLRRRKGAEADQPHRIAYKKLVRG